MAYTGYTISNLDVFAGPEKLGRIALADKDSCDRFTKWWFGQETTSKDRKQNDIIVAKGIVTKGAKDDAERKNALQYFGVDCPLDRISTVVFSEIQLRFDTIDVFFSKRCESSSPAKLLYDRMGNLTGEELKQEVSKLSSDDRSKFLKLMANGF